MRVLVTGGAGFVGTHLVKKLSEARHDVISIDSAISEKHAIEQRYVWSDICSYKSLTKLRSIIEGIDIVYHLAARKDLQASHDHVIQYHNTNVVGSLNLLELCREVGVKRFVFASSCAVYGESCVSGYYDETSPTEPLSPYGLQKLTVEKYCKLYSKYYGLDTVALRYFNIYGPGTEEGVIPTLLKQHKNNKPLTIFGSGENSRDFVHVDDVVNATILAGEYNSEHYGDVFNVASGDSTSVNEIALAICKDDKKIKRLPSKPETSSVCGQISKIKKILDWNPTISIEDWLSVRYPELY
jgi:UDP-glucose 4-epimerase